MLWFTVWAVLVVGTLVGAFFLLRHVYRSGKALLVELGRASEVLTRLGEQIEALTEAAEQRDPPRPVDLTDPEPARMRRAEGAVAAQRRRAARLDRRAATYRRWRALTH
ncbi:hypothetical protein [Actinotalea sp.]|mgnify:CR=1 FL=1|uniref:hypothetical protein n=1 Tax=Actinotalea sp. TaxID=1872145 RepID=UPI002BD7CADC|nr:hypothetical protein [Actinotalea sp.]HQY32656.1 hypothetical protein [Actinotalea sp.]HRA50442.1 hypothetical protein [Actinotalea sp.]